MGVDLKAPYNSSHQVRAISLPRLVTYIEKKLHQTRGDKKGKIVMKLDVEASEFLLMPSLQGWGKNEIYNFKEALDMMPCAASKGKLSPVDDESYLHDGVPLPNTSVCKPSH